MLQTLDVAVGAGRGIWGAINLLESESGITGGTKAAEADHSHVVEVREEPCLTGSVNRASKALKEAVASYYTNFRAAR